MSGDLEINQRKLGHSRTFHFAGHELIYTLRDPSGERTFAVPYQVIDTSEISEVRSTNPRFVHQLNRAVFAGFLLSFALAAFQNTAGGVVGIGSIIAYIACWLAHSAGWFSVNFTHIPMNPVPAGANNRLISIIGDNHRDQVVAELTSRSHKRLRELYGTVNLAANLDQEAQRLKWLYDRKIISDKEYEGQLGQIRALQEVPFSQKQSLMN